MCSSCLFRTACLKCLLHKACDYRHSIVLLLLSLSLHLSLPPPLSPSPLSLPSSPSLSPFSLSLSLSLSLTLSLPHSQPFSPPLSFSLFLLSLSQLVRRDTEPSLQRKSSFSRSFISRTVPLNLSLSFSLCIGIIVGQLVLSSCTT